MTRISVSCPKCETTYQVAPDLRGRRIRCPNPVCQAVFEIPGALEKEAPQPAPESTGPIAGAVGDIVPVLQAEIAATTAAPVEKLPSRFPELPPRRRRPKPPSLAVADEPADADVFRQFEEMAAGDNEPAPVSMQAPPIRRIKADDVLSDGSPEPQGDTTAPPAIRRRSRRLLAGLTLLLIVGIAGGAWLVLQRQSDVEAELSAHAENALQKGDFAQAATAFRRLLLSYPSSSQRQRYLLHAELSSVLDAVYAPVDSSEPVKTLGRLGQFLQVHEGAESLSRQRKELWRAARKLALQILDQAEETKDAQLLGIADRAWEAALRIQGGQGNSPKETREVRNRVARLRESLADQQRRNDVLAQLRELPPSAKAVQQARAIVRSEKLENDSAALTLLAELIKKHIGTITYRAAPVAPSPPEDADDAYPTIVFAAPDWKREILHDSLPTRGEGILAMARGVLYAVDAGDGSIHWARRIGADSLHLPVRLPATAITPEAALCVSADQNRVLAVAASDGNVLWQHRLGAACIARPLIAGDRILFPTVTGRVEELDAVTGRLLGAYELGQRLSLAGVRQAAGALAYFAADELCVYVIDLAQRQCAGVLYTGHARGSLRTPPLLAGDDYFVLSQADAEHTKLRVFELPIASPDQPAAAEARVAGWCSFPAYQDGESLALASDAGVFAILGIRQPGNRDPVVFPMVEQRLAGSGKPGCTAQLSHIEGDNCWVFCDGQLQLLQKSLSREKGPVLGPRWAAPVRLGSPLHASQMIKSNGELTLHVVTQAEDSTAVHLTALAADTGRVLWRQQLGLLVGEAAAIGSRLLLCDDAGLFLMEAPPPKNERFVVAQCQRLPLPLTPSPPGRGEVQILRSEETATIIHGAGKIVSLQSISPGGREAAWRTIKLSAPLAGVVGMGQGYLVAPLATGLLERASTAGEECEHGPNWRSGHADEGSRSFVVSLGGDEFIVSDGDRGLRVIHWPEAKLWEKKAARELSTTIIAAPALLPGRRVAVGEASGVVTVIDAGTLEPLGAWQLPGRITAGPFVRGDEIGCVVEHRRLVWIDPATDAPVWEYAFVADIIGEPNTSGDRVIVATAAGQFFMFDRTTGPIDDGYLLRANVAPVTAPLPLPDGRMLAPLSDGTAMLLNLDRAEKQ